MTSKFIFVIVALIDLTALAGTPKFYCYRAQGKGQNVFEAGYKSCPDTKTDATTPPSKVCIQLALCWTASEDKNDQVDVKKEIVRESSLLKGGDEIPFEKLSDEDISKALKSMADNDAAFTSATELICKAPNGVCPPPTKCQDDMYYNLLPDNAKPGDDYDYFPLNPTGKRITK